MTRMVQCIKLKREAEGLGASPYPGELGQRIYDHVSRLAWAEWLEHQKRLINEYKLSLADTKARTFLASEMEKYFFGGGDLTGTGYVPPGTGDSGAGSPDETA
ncbi:MAG: oxidative damage protection protein [Nevskiales bacterium]